MPAFLKDILPKIIVATFIFDVAMVDSSELPSRMSHYRPLPPSTISSVRRKQKHESPLIRYQAQEDTGYYKFGYAVADGQFRVEEGSPKDGILGSYGYIGTDGREIKVFYKADNQGFQIITADAYKSLSEAKKRYHYHDGPSKTNAVQPGQDTFYRHGQELPKDIEESDVVGVFGKNGHEFSPTNEDDLKKKPATEIPDEIVIDEHLPNEPAVNTDDVQPQPPSLTFNSNTFPVRFLFTPPTMNPGFANQIPSIYYPNFRYENPFIVRRNPFVSTEMQRFAPLIIRVK